ncbi:hypothetical protein [Knoellia aerolata]|uniref:Polysaccharide chain length determinant N-terminal domain-containing protein n=1 Tax=Knoellia aerolata DSM 18566 TaxID=1385519 RepID=A0A0A0JX45_9MICO|nr:hypothetical protein [Knoellia aerolata]KGN40632.1 hypothetical protein N801_12890 [Knoellia aerolata DSM 18566]
MSGPVWRIDDEDGDPDLTGAPSPLLVTVRTLGAALARTWSTVLAVCCLGVLVGLGVLSMVPHPVSATATLLMVAPNPDDASAMTTDISLLQTRAVGERVIAELDLEESPESLLSTVTATPVSNQIMTVSVDGPDDDEALRRATSVVAHFLEFRAEQLRTVSAGLVAGYERRIASLQARVGELTREYDRASAATVDQVRLSDIVTERAALGTQVTDLQRSIEDATLASDAAVSATHVIDEPAATPFGSRRQVVLVGASGGLVGGVLAVGTILLRTLTSERLYRRRDVASALGVPVRVGVGTIPSGGRLSRIWTAVTRGIATVLRGHPRRWSEPLRSRRREALVQGLRAALPSPLGTPEWDEHVGGAGARAGERSGPTSLGLAPMDRAATGATVLRALADRLVERGGRVLLVDLTASGALVGTRATEPTEAPVDGPGALTLFRPEGDPALTPGPLPGPRRRGPSPEGLDRLSAVWDEVDVVLALVEVDPGLDLDVLATWVDQVVPLVTAGRTSRELLTTIASLVAEAGVDLPFALLEGADRSDRSSGRGAPSGEEPADLPADERPGEPVADATRVRAVHAR